MPARVVAAVLAVLIILQPDAARAARPRPLAGLTLADAIAELQKRGLRVLFTTSLVLPDMRVREEPLSRQPRTVLEEILAPHGLRLSETARGHLVIVAAEPVLEQRQPPAPMPVFLEEVVVTPGRLRILDERLGASQFLGRTEIDRMPRPGDDLLWVVRRLPGIASSDVSAEMRVRGGEADEMLVLLDGVEIHEPFHLKDFMKMFSILDASAAGVVDVHTGGFPVEYGGRMGGVLDIATRIPPAARETSVSVGTTSAGLLASGTHGSGEGHWLVGVRGWYPDVLVGSYVPRGSNLSTDYFDLLATLSQPAGSHSTLSAGLLAASDDVGYDTRDADGHEGASGRYQSAQSWLSLETRWAEGLRSRTVLSVARIDRERIGSIFDRTDGTIDVRDERVSALFGLKQDWAMAASERHYLKAGFDAKRQGADYDYSRVEVLTDPDVVGDGPPLRTEVAVGLRPSGSSASVYAADRVRLGQRLTAEAGLRWDRAGWIDGSQVAPRLNLAWAADPLLTFRGAWGRYHQWQQLNELQVEDGVDRFHRAQRAEQWLFEVERRLPRGTLLRAGAYRRRVTRVKPRFENLFNPMELLPEAETDRVLVAPDRAIASGIELLAAGGPDARFGWWVSYTNARSSDEIEGDLVARGWDQRHAATFGLTGELRGWALHVGGTWRSGWPTTEMAARIVDDDPEEPEIELVRGPRNGARLPSYMRLDTRVTRRFEVRRGTVSLTADVLNATGRSNVCCIDDFQPYVVDGRAEVRRDERVWPRVLPSFSLRWQF